MPFSREKYGTLSAATDHVDLSCAGFGGVGIRVSGSFVGTITFQGSVDGRQYDTLTLVTFDGSTTATTTTGVGQWLGPCAGLTVVRVTMTSYTSGIANVAMLASEESGARPGGGGGGAGNPASPSTSVQFNNGGSFGGSANFTWDGSGLTIAGLAASTGLANVLFASDTGLIEPVTGIVYNSAYTGPAGTDPPHASLVTTTAITANPTFTHFALGQQGIYSNVTYTPSSDAVSGNMRGVFSSVHATGTKAAYIISAVDAFSSVDSGQAYLTVIGVTAVATVAGASTGISNGAIIGMVASGVQQHASASSPLVISLSVDPTNGGSRTLLGTVTTLYGARIVGMTTANLFATATTRAGLYLDVMPGSATNDYAILSDATQPVKLASTSVLLASGNILNWNGGTITLTQNPLNLTLAGSGAASLLVTNGALQAGSHVGGAGTASTIKIYPTFGAGTTGADIIFAGGSNGATEWGRFLHGGQLRLGVAGTLSGAMSFQGSTSGAVTLQASGSAITSYTLTWPLAAPGTNGFVLSGTTAGVLSWVANGSGGSGATTALDNLASVAINTTLLPGANDGAALGNGSFAFSDLFLASGGVLNWNNGTITLTQNPLNLTLAGSGSASFIVTSGAVISASMAGGSTGTSTLNLYPTVGTGTTGADLLISNGTNGATERMRLLHAGQFGIGVTAPTAVLHLKAGTTAASTAPLKFNTGSLMTSAEAGAVEFLTDAFYGTITTGAARKTFAFLESPAFTTPDIGVATGTSLAATGTLKSTQSINATSTDGLILTNTTAAAAGAQQWSPRIRLTGQGWRTNATAQSETIDWIMEAVPVQGSADPTSSLTFSSQVNGGGYTARLAVSSAGVVSATTGGSSFSIPSSLVFASVNSVTLVADTTATLALRSTTNAQKFRIYNTFTTLTTAGEWAKFDWITTANQLRIGTVMGTVSGTARVMSLDYGGLEASPTAAITIPITSGNIVFGGAITTPGGATFHTTNTALTDGAGASAGTIANAPSIGNPTKWIGVNDNGTTRYIPAW